MSTSSPTLVRAAAHLTLRSSLTAHFELGKPRLALAATVLAICGLTLAADFDAGRPTILKVASGVLLASFGCAAFNMLIERHRDAAMQRTAGRPLPSGRVSPKSAGLYGLVCISTGIALLASINSLCASFAAAMAVLYVGVYTPLKARSPWNTAVGAVPGALPPVIGCVAVTGDLNPWAITLFVTVFFWQIPHFLPLAGLYRDDYLRGGMRMIPGEANGASRMRNWLLPWTLATILASLSPIATNLVAPWATALVIPLGVWFGSSVVRVAQNSTQARLRCAFRRSLVYLGVLVSIFLVAKT